MGYENQLSQFLHLDGVRLLVFGRPRGCFLDGRERNVPLHLQQMVLRPRRGSRPRPNEVMDRGPMDARSFIVIRGFSMISLVPAASYGTHPLSAYVCPFLAPVPNIVRDRGCPFLSRIKGNEVFLSQRRNVWDSSRRAIVCNEDVIYKTARLDELKFKLRRLLRKTSLWLNLCRSVWYLKLHG